MAPAPRFPDPAVQRTQVSRRDIPWLLDYWAGRLPKHPVGELWLRCARGIQLDRLREMAYSEPPVQMCASLAGHPGILPGGSLGNPRGGYR